MLLFACDLDNTLIYSHRHDIGTDKIPVELYDGRIVSFMTRHTQELLDEIYHRTIFVPVSTRSIAQYQRICFHPDWTPAFALVSNGGSLLLDGLPDAEWFAQSNALAAPAEADLCTAEKILQTDPNRTLEVRRVDGLFVFTKSSDVPATMARLCTVLPPERVYSGGQKIYVLPEALNKGRAIQRLRARFPGIPVVAAGDSQFDIPLLAAADFAFYPESLDYQPHANQTGRLLPASDGIFSDVLLEQILTLIENDAYGSIS